MDEENLSNDSCSSTKSFKDLETGGNKWRQIFIAFAICYICISGGNLVGFTSSAIPSIRKGDSDPFIKILWEDEIKSNQNYSVLIQDEAYREVETMLESIGKKKRQNEMKFQQQFVELTDSQASWIGGLAPLGAFLGSLIATVPIKFLGPKGTLLKLGAPFYVLSWFGTSLSPGLIYVYASRLIGGLAMGITFSAVPIYIVEIASLELRGPLGTLSQFLFTVGVLISFITGYLFDWRKSAIVSGLLVLPTFIILPFLPESPLWLVSKKRCTEAEAAFRRIRGFSIQSTEFQQLYHKRTIDDNFNSQLENNSEHSPSIKSNSRSIFVAIFLCIFQQLTGINGINFYMVTLFEIPAGQDSFLDGHSSAILVALVFCLANICSYFLIERLGRKSLLIISTVFLSISAFSLGTYFYILDIGVDTSHLSFVPLASLITFVLAFSCGYGPLLYVIVAEILPQNIRSTVTPVAVGINWLFVFIVAKSHPEMMHIMKAYGAFWLYGSFSCVSLIFTIFYVPESKGKTESEIQDFFIRRSK